MKPTKMKGYLYNTLPRIYRQYDRDFQLKRLLEVLDEGLDYQLEDTKRILDLIDIDTCPEEYLELISISLGIRYEPVIPLIYQRRFLKNAIMLNKRKGSLNALEYLLRELFESEPTLSLDMDTKTVLIAVEYGIEDINAQTQKLGFERILKYFIPVFFDLELMFIASAPRTTITIGVAEIWGEEVRIYPRKG